MTEICEDLLNEGVCHRSNCPHSHDVLPCKTCKMVFYDASTYENHLRTSPHERRARQETRRRAGIPQIVLCTVCNTEISDSRLYAQHAVGRQHIQKLAEQRLTSTTDPGPEEVDVPKNCIRCDVCCTSIPKFFWERHPTGARHLQALKFNSLKGALDESERNKNGVVIKHYDRAIDFGFVEYEHRASPVHTLSVDIKNTNATSIYIVEGRLTSETTSRASQSHFKLDRRVARIKIKSGYVLTLSVTFDSRRERGSFEDRIELIFEDPTVGRRFSITRSLLATVGVKADYDTLKASAPYVRPKPKTEMRISEVTLGVPPDSIAEIVWKVKLDLHKAPKNLNDIAFGAGSPSQLAVRVRSAFLPTKFINTTYGRHFSVLLWVEEERARRDLQLYDVEGATLTKDPKHPKYFELEVDGLAEKRPSVIVTDRFLVKEHASDPRAFEGHVHVVKEKSVLLQFHSRFQPIRGQKFFVRFDLNRLVFRRMHQALGTAFNPNRVLFPHADDLRGLRRIGPQDFSTIRTFDRKIERNPPQLLAVTSIVSRPPGSVPFIVFGPPGTGKTVTVIEAMRQILHSNPNARILACAPSNSAADLIAERLAELGKNQLFRLNAPSRSKRTVPRSVLPFSLLNSSDMFCAPSPEALVRFRVVVSTCMSASIPYGIGVRRGHFTHIFIDEAGQATEPEAMIPIKDNADSATNVILSGDSKQLGPIVRSPVALELGLGVSYLDRLMQNPIYDEVEGKGVTIVKLIKNWRSHNAILKFPNEEFYKSELEACGDPAITESLLRWDGLVQRGFPVIFHGVSGKDEREASSPSFFNIAEASLVKTYVQDLFEDRRLRLTSEHIGIISPYHAQVGKIRSVLPRNGKDIKVGSVEEYQGQERRVIIISTVRSSLDFVSFDLRHTLGFVANPRRFNVAITRAQALLIVIGDPQVLSLDPLWKAFLNYVYLGGGWKGKSMDWDPRERVDRRGTSAGSSRRTAGLTELDALIQRTKEDIINVTEDMAGLALDDVEGNVDKPWREDD